MNGIISDRGEVFDFNKLSSEGKDIPDLSDRQYDTALIFNISENILYVEGSFVTGRQFDSLRRLLRKNKMMLDIELYKNEGVYFRERCGVGAFLERDDYFDFLGHVANQND